jgi:hypothetical protein
VLVVVIISNDVVVEVKGTNEVEVVTTTDVVGTVVVGLTVVVVFIIDVVVCGWLVVEVVVLS